MQRGGSSVSCVLAGCEGTVDCVLKRTQGILIYRGDCVKTWRDGCRGWKNLLFTLPWARGVGGGGDEWGGEHQVWSGGRRKKERGESMARSLDCVFPGKGRAEETAPDWLV